MHLYDVIMCVAITLYTDMCSFLLGVRESLTTKMRNVFEVKFSKGTESLKSSIQQIEQRRNEDTLRLKGSVKVTSRGEYECVLGGRVKAWGYERESCLSLAVLVAVGWSQRSRRSNLNIAKHSRSVCDIDRWVWLPTPPRHSVTPGCVELMSVHGTGIRKSPKQCCSED